MSRWKRGAVIRLLVAEDTSILHETLVTLFSLEGGIEVVAQVAGVSGFLLKGVPAATLIGAVRSAARPAGSRRPG